MVWGSLGHGGKTEGDGLGGSCRGEGVGRMGMGELAGGGGVFFNFVLSNDAFLK